MARHVEPPSPLLTAFELNPLAHLFYFYQGYLPSVHELHCKLRDLQNNNCEKHGGEHVLVCRAKYQERTYLSPGALVNS